MSGEHKKCKPCGIEAYTAESIEEIFGYRKVKEGKSIPQSWCRECRAFGAKKRREALKREKEEAKKKEEEANAAQMDLFKEEDVDLGERAAKLAEDAVKLAEAVLQEKTGGTR